MAKLRLGKRIKLELSKISERALMLHRARLESDENEGIYVECDSCGKTRHLKTIQDPSSLYSASYTCQSEGLWWCTDPENENLRTMQFIKCKFVPGSLVLARIGKQLKDLWPGIVEDCPDKKSQFCVLRSDKSEFESEPFAYFVTLIGYSDGQRYGYWLATEDLRPLRKEDSKSCSNFSRDPAHRGFALALEQAKAGLPKTLAERLREFSFLSSATSVEHLKVKTSPLSESKADSFASEPAELDELNSTQVSMELGVETKAVASLISDVDAQAFASPPPTDNEYQSGNEEDWFKSPPASPPV